MTITTEAPTKNRLGSQSALSITTSRHSTQEAAAEKATLMLDKKIAEHQLTFTGVKLQSVTKEFSYIPNTGHTATFIAILW